MPAFAKHSCNYCKQNCKVYRRSVMPLLEFRCEKCGKLLGYIDGKAQIKCPRCGAMNTKDTRTNNLSVTSAYRLRI